VRLTVLGSCGAFPQAGDACSGFLVEHDGFRLVLDLGYATMPRLVTYADAAAIDAVFITHGHPDHCADLNPLLRARALRPDPPRPLRVYALAGALDVVLRLDRPGMLDDACELVEFEAGTDLELGPFVATTAALPHFRPNAGIRLQDPSGAVLTYTGDCGPSPAVVQLAREADVLLAEATHLDDIPEDDRPYLTTAAVAGEQAAAAGVRRLLLTHLWPGTDPREAIAAARRAHPNVEVATAGLVTTVEASP
jgi:ribonuclease BN (tRNA processing enzyme)